MSRIRRWPDSRSTILTCVLLAGATACGPGGAVDAIAPRAVADAGPTVSAARRADVGTLAGVCDATLDESALAAAGWTRTWNEEFAGGLGQWTAWTGGAFNNELQHYQPANLAVSDGVLRITAKRETVTGATTPWDPTPKRFDFTSGRIESTTHFSAGTATPRVRMSARLRLPAGTGMWPAFWSYGDPWPTQGEIDIVEARGSEPFQYQTAYWYGSKAGRNQARNSATVVRSDANLQSCWHVYEVIWAKNTLTFLLDGAVVDTKSGGYIPNMFGKAQRLTLNLAVGGNFFSRLDPRTIQPGEMQVDWVKVFTAP